MSLDVESLYPKIFNPIQTYNPYWNRAWASLEEDLKYGTSYKPEWKKLNIEDAKLQLNSYYKLLNAEGMFKIDDIIKDIYEKEKLMNNINTVKETLKVIANGLDVKVFINELPKNKHLDLEVLFFNPNEDRTRLFYLVVDELKDGWMDGIIDDVRDHVADHYSDYHRRLQELSYIKADINSVYGRSAINKKPSFPKIKDVKFNGPATIVFWSDNTKTVVKAHNEDVDYEKGLAMAIAKKSLGNKGNYFNEFKKWLPEEEETAEITLELEGGILEDLTKNIKEAFCPQNMEFKFKVKEKNNEKNNKK